MGSLISIIALIVTHLLALGIGYFICECVWRDKPQGCYECANRKRWESYEKAGLPPVHYHRKETEH